jgi:hypothetical protein
MSYLLIFLFLDALNKDSLSKIYHNNEDNLAGINANYYHLLSYLDEVMLYPLHDRGIILQIIKASYVVNHESGSKF